MPKFVALTSKGLAPTLEQELNQMGIHQLKPKANGFEFESNWRTCYQANLTLRTGTRILMPILDFNAYNGDDLYNNTKKHDFTKYIDVNQTFEVITSSESKIFHSQPFIMQRVKDAIVDQFRDKYGERPNVSKENPDVRVYVRVKESDVNLAIDTTGDSLAFRGYRREAGKAPLREHMAAALVMLSGWQPGQCLVDPMCGSGTILIEAALMARKIATGLERNQFAFQKLKGFQREAWDEVVNQAMDAEAEPLEQKLFGYDINGKIIPKARANAERAGVEEDIEFFRSDIRELNPPAESGVLIVNPPYAERMGESLEEIKDVYRDFGYTLKKSFKGWTCWLLSGNKDISGAIGLKASQRIPVFNGNIECRFLKYEIR